MWLFNYIKSNYIFYVAYFKYFRILYLSLSNLQLSNSKNIIFDIPKMRNILYPIRIRYKIHDKHFTTPETI